MTSKCSKLCSETTCLRLLVPLSFEQFDVISLADTSVDWKIVVDLLIDNGLFMRSLHKAVFVSSQAYSQ